MDDILKQLSDEFEETRRKALVKFIMKDKPADYPMNETDARLMVDLAAKAWEDVQRLIIKTADMVPEEQRAMTMSIILKTVDAGVTHAIADGIAVLEAIEGECDCSACRYQRAFAAGEDMTQHPVTLELLADGFEVIGVEGSGVLLQRVDKGKPH